MDNLRRQVAGGGSGWLLRNVGDVERELGAAERVLDRTYELRPGVPLRGAPAAGLSGRHAGSSLASVARIRAGLSEGRIAAWDHRQAQTQGEPDPAGFPAAIVPHCRVEWFPPACARPPAAWRTARDFPWIFAAESMLDELAHATHADPLAFRLRAMTPHKAYRIEHWAADWFDSGRMAACYARAAELAGWGRRLPADTGLGIAGCFSLGTYAAVVIEARVDAREGLEIQKAWGAVDCGVAGQRGDARAKNGFIEGVHAQLSNVVSPGSGNGSRLRQRRGRGTPFAVEIEAGGSVRAVRGAGELPAAPAAAALANAVHAACGRRIRSLAAGGSPRRDVQPRRSRSIILESRPPRRARRRERDGGSDERFR